jgi:hypothetical protein
VRYRLTGTATIATIATIASVTAAPPCAYREQVASGRELGWGLRPSIIPPVLPRRPIFASIDTAACSLLSPYLPVAPTPSAPTPSAFALLPLLVLSPLAAVLAVVVVVVVVVAVVIVVAVVGGK